LVFTGFLGCSVWAMHKDELRSDLGGYKGFLFIGSRNNPRLPLSFSDRVAASNKDSLTTIENVSCTIVQKKIRNIFSLTIGFNRWASFHCSSTRKPPLVHALGLVLLGDSQTLENHLSQLLSQF
jgi:hypothetical protein